MLTIRPATALDVPLILQFVRELADYEKEPQSAVATEEDFLRFGFGPEPKFHCVIAEWNGEPAGFALYFFNFSTWTGHPGLYLEDLFVRPRYRGKGIGKSLFVHLAQIALAQECGRFQWQVLDWNQPAIDFYHSAGAKLMSEWLTMRMEGDSIRQLAESEVSVQWSEVSGQHQRKADH
jgi:GNAT superfamily N-acetyltransferase